MRESSRKSRRRGVIRDKHLHLPEHLAPGAFATPRVGGEVLDNSEDDDTDDDIHDESTVEDPTQRSATGLTAVFRHREEPRERQPAGSDPILQRLQEMQRQRRRELDEIRDIETQLHQLDEAPPTVEAHLVHPPPMVEATPMLFPSDERDEGQDDPESDNISDKEEESGLHFCCWNWSPRTAGAVILLLTMVTASALSLGILLTRSENSMIEKSAIIVDDSSATPSSTQASTESPTSISTPLATPRPTSLPDDDKPTSLPTSSSLRPTDQPTSFSTETTNTSPPSYSPLTTPEPSSRPTYMSNPQPSSIPTDATTSSPLTQSPTDRPFGSWKQIGPDIAGEASSDFFGNSVAISSDGNIVAGGGQGSMTSTGRVRVFHFSSFTKQWYSLGQPLDGEAVNDQFGQSVALSADGFILAASATTSDRTGRVRVFEYFPESNRWFQVGQRLEGAVQRDYFGHDVALSANGKILAIGADQTGLSFDEDNTQRGRVIVYKYNADTRRWGQMGETLIGEGMQDEWGFSLALNAAGNIVAASAVWNDGFGVNSGHVRVFEYNATDNTWEQLGQDIDGAGANDEFGWSIALSNSGTIVAAGASENDGNGVSSGHVRVFQLDQASNRWVQLGQSIVGEKEGDKFGVSVSLSADGMTVAAGAHFNDGRGSASGHVRVFRYSHAADQWMQLGEDIDGAAIYYRFGTDVALSADGSIVAAGCRRSTSKGEYTGHIGVFGEENQY